VNVVEHRYRRVLRLLPVGYRTLWEEFRLAGALLWAVELALAVVCAIVGVVSLRRLPERSH
jgi:hypothetical protein